MPVPARCAIALLLLFALPRGGADAQVDPSGAWRTLHTEHFRIHFRPAYRAVAHEAAREAERAYGLLASELHVPRGGVDLTLADEADAPNGFASVYPSNRVTILLPPPAADPDLQNYDSWLRLVIVHELTHVFHLDRARPVGGSPIPIRAHAGIVPQRVPTHLGDRRAGDVLRVAFHRRRSGRWELPASGGRR